MLVLGNPSVVLIDEFSTGIDAKMKRDMWGTLRNVAVGKAIVITTRKSRADQFQVGYLCQDLTGMCRLDGGSLGARQQGWHSSEEDAR